MGIADMVMKFGYDVLWYAVGYAAGYVFLLLFIAGPLRRFGAYTIPDFAEGRFDSKGMRKVAVTLALAISFFYMMPQMKGAGITLAQLLGSPYWVGVAVVGIVVTANVILGGMKGITLVQAFQYWVKMFAISIPIFILFTVYGGYGQNVTDAGNMLRLDANKQVVESADNAQLILAEDRIVTYSPMAEMKFSGTEATIIPATDVPVTVVTYGASGEVLSKKKVTLSGGEPYTWAKSDATPSQKLIFAEKTAVTLTAGMTIPNIISGNQWLTPFGPFTSKYVNPLDEGSVKWVPLLYTYSLIIALLCGTAGLPHILVRFYTNPNGRQAKKTTLLVIGMLSLFYIFPAMWGALGRVNIPGLLANGATDLVTRPTS